MEELFAGRYQQPATGLSWHGRHGW